MSVVGAPNSGARLAEPCFAAVAALDVHKPARDAPTCTNRCCL
jgi:hypothetical protein